MPTRRPTPFLVALTGSVILAACSGGDARVVELTASDDACVAASTQLDAGKTTFRIRNEGDEVTEVYVYTNAGRVVTERENIGPATSADLTANLAAGTYELACKPGQKGDGIRQTITVTGMGGETSPTSGDLDVHLTAVDFRFQGLDSLSVRAGERVKFEMTNKGAVEHEFEVFGPDGEAIGEVGPTAAGAEGDVVLTLKEPGTYRYVCGIENHEQQGMAGTFEVK